MTRLGKILLLSCYIAGILSVALAGTASAAILPFEGIEYSWLHTDEYGRPEGNWITQINDTITGRAGDSMQFQNRWYNNYAGTADIRISYGGGQSYTCIGADESVFYGLNYGNYYPSGTESMPVYSTIVASQSDPNSLDEYNLVANHQYVYNGIKYGCSEVTDRWTIRFRVDSSTLVTDTVEDAGQQNDTLITPTPVITGLPSATPVLNNTPTPIPTPAPGFGTEITILTVLAIASAGYCVAGKR